MTPPGQIYEVLLPYQEYPTAIAGGDGQLWFAEPTQIASLDRATLVPPPTTPCLTATASVVLHHDVGPCSADGIVVTGSKLKVNLAGHKVFAAPGARVADYAGIHLKNATGVTVQNGEVTGFDAGVWIESGSGNTLKQLEVHDNLGPANNAANMGDGIVVYHSPGNHITANHVVHNGVFDGIAKLGVGSDNNLISDNQVSDTTDE